MPGHSGVAEVPMVLCRSRLQCRHLDRAPSRHRPGALDHDPPSRRVGYHQVGRHVHSVSWAAKELGVTWHTVMDAHATRSLRWKRCLPRPRSVAGSRRQYLFDPHEGEETFTGARGGNAILLEAQSHSRRLKFRYKKMHTTTITDSTSG